MKENFKKRVKNTAYLIWAHDIDELEEILESYNYISFDIFDTLIKRNVREPEDIFRILENKTGIRDFKQKRILAEKVAMQKSIDEEITLEDIYEELALPSRIMNLEIELEKKFCTRNIPIARLYEKLLQEGKKIYLTSDMYLPRYIIEEILNQNGYKSYEAIYLSSEQKKRKTSGNLFSVLLKENNIDAKHIVHVGDTINADYLIPKKMGIKALLVHKKVKRTKFASRKANSDIYANILESFLNNNVNTEDVYEHFGYEVFGPILYSFTTWLREEIEKSGIKKVAFFARDAKIVMKAYEKRFGNELPSRYLRISRKAALNAMLGDAKNIDEIFETYKVIRKDTTSVDDLLNILDIQIALDTRIRKKMSSELSISENRELFANIHEKLMERSNEQRNLLSEYLTQDKIHGKIGLIDVGWNGSTQYCIEKITNEKFTGYYYGVNKDKKYQIYESMNRKGFLFDDKFYNKNQALIWMNSGLFELMFLTPEGTTRKYTKKNNKVMPILDKCEYSSESLKIIEKIQKGALKFIDNADNSKIKDYLLEMSAEIGFDNFKEFSIHPTNEDINLFKKIEFQNFKRTTLLNNKNFWYYMLYPKKFYHDLMDNHCKVWFMKNVFRLNISYFNILERLYRKLKKLN